MRDLDAPRTPDEIYRDRGTVEITVPVNQGDVFVDVEVPGLDPGPQTVQVVMHPCSLREGPGLRQRVTVAPVSQINSRISERAWKHRYFNHMLLPDLREDSVSYVVDFRDSAPVSNEQLQLGCRIAALSNLGVILLQQRAIVSQSRLAVPISDLEDESSAVLTELEIQETWTELALDAASDSDDLATLDVAVHEFQGWLDSDGKRRRRMLQDKTLHAELRRLVNREARARYKSQ